MCVDPAARRNISCFLSFASVFCCWFECIYLHVFSLLRASFVVGLSGIYLHVHVPLLFSRFEMKSWDGGWEGCVESSLIFGANPLLKITSVEWNEWHGDDHHPSLKISSCLLNMFFPLIIGQFLMKGIWFSPR
jgi:hypothetical protein